MKKIGHAINWLPSVDSTNQELARWIGDGKSSGHGMVIAAIEQTEGKGMAGNTWESEPGKNLTFSVVVHPGFLKADQQFYLNMCVSLGVHAYLASVISKEEVAIKWPNDLYVGANKIAGILINHTISGNEIMHSIIGIGLNVNQLIFSSGVPNPVSLCKVLGGPLDPALELNKLLAHLDHQYDVLSNQGFSECRETYKKNLLGYQKWLVFKHDGDLVRAKISGVSETGLLQLCDEHSVKFECDFKEIEFLF